METLKLGGNIELVGFRELDKSEMVVVKKIVGNYVRKLTELCNKFEQLSLTLKPVHKREKSESFEIHAKLLDNGKPFVSLTTDRNLYVAIDNALKKIVKEIS